MRLLYFFFLQFLSYALFGQDNSNIQEKYLATHGASLLETYRYLHANPELSRMEASTALFLKEKVRTYGYKITDSLGYHSFAAIMENGTGPVILYRTDLDALPIKEETGLSYASKMIFEKDGEKRSAMHACGHDMHMTAWLGLAHFLSQNKKSWKGTMIFLAQSAEETGQGAKQVVNSGNYKSIPRPDLQLAIHMQPDLPVGTVGFCDDYAMASVDMMQVTIYGKGGHGAAPEKTIDPVVMSAQFINDIQTIVSRNLSSREPAVITVGAIHGGTAGNIIPEKVELKLTIRSFTAESRQKILDRIKKIGDGISRSAGMEESKLPTYDLGDMSIPSVYNDPLLGEKIREILKKDFGPTAVASFDPVMIGEDFGVYGRWPEPRPSYLLWMGALEKPGKEKPGLHSAQFAPDAATAIPSTMRMMGTVLLKLFNQKN
jgi:hippurate hydrolase